MAVAHNSTTQGSSGTSTVTLSHTVAGANTYILIFFRVLTAGRTVNVCTYNGVAAGLITSDVRTSVEECYVYGLVAPASGAHNVVVTMSGSNAGLQVIAKSFTGVDQSNPVASSNHGVGAGTSSFSLALTPPAGGMGADHIAGEQTSARLFTVGANQAEDYNEGSGQHPDASSHTTSIDGTMDWTASGNLAFIFLAVALAQVAAAGGRQFQAQLIGS